MGWNSLGCAVSEDLLLNTATKIVDLGLRDVGYNYIVLDDCWSDGRDKKGKIKVDLDRFPHGMKKEDAQSFASWDVDYLKYDNCYALGRHGTAEASFNRYNTMAQALNDTDKPILYSLCSWGEDFVNSWGVSIANFWRISGDIYDPFSRPDDLCSCTAVDPASPFCIALGSRCSVMTIVNRVAPYADRGQPGGWQDLDMLEVGQGGMTDEEYKSPFSLWAALKSPLLIGAYIRSLDPEALTILNNPAIIAINQDPLGLPATRIFRDTDLPKDRFGQGETQILSGPLYGGDQLLLLLNAADTDHDITAYLEDVFVRDGPGGSAPQCAESWDVNDLWETRMDPKLAQLIVDGERVEKIYDESQWYNSTVTSYAEGLKAGDPRLMGEKVTEI